MTKTTVGIDSSVVVYSGLIELDTLILDNTIHYRGEHEYKTSAQNLYHGI